jgi:hypothetical protein
VTKQVEHDGTRWSAAIIYILAAVIVVLVSYELAKGDDGLAMRDFVAVLALITSVAAIGVSARIGSAAGRRTALTTYFALLDRYESAHIASARRDAVTARRDGHDIPEATITIVLNAFEYIALSAKDDVVNIEVIWSWIGDRAVAYWYAFETQLASWRAEDPTYYEEYAALVTTLTDMSRRHGSTITDPPDPNWVDRILTIDCEEATRLTT